MFFVRPALHTTRGADPSSYEAYPQAIAPALRPSGGPRGRHRPRRFGHLLTSSVLAPSTNQCHRGKDLAFGHVDAVCYFATVVPYFPSKAPNLSLSLSQPQWTDEVAQPDRALRA